MSNSIMYGMREAKYTAPNLNSSTWTEHIIVLDLSVSVSLCTYQKGHSIPYEQRRCPGPKSQTNPEEPRWYRDVDFHT